MAAVQQVDRIMFGSGRLFQIPAGGGARLPYGDVKEASVDMKVDLKEIYGEGGYPIAVADGHRTIDVSAKHYALRLDVLANDLGVAAPGNLNGAMSWDEAGSVPAATPYQPPALAQGANLVPGSLVLKVFVKPTGSSVATPVIYSIVPAGSEVAGRSASVSSSGVLTFAAGDAGSAFQATYQYGGTGVTGQSITLTNTFQNSTTPMQMVLAKRDKSIIDGSIGQLILTLNAVRFGGIKLTYTEGDFTVNERTFKAFADPTGTVGTLQFVNTTTNTAP
jgi:hypothetical protein